MNSAINIHELRSMAELSETIGLQKAVWRMTDIEVASPHTLKAIAHTGGCVLGARLGGRLVGFCTGFAARRGEQLFLWSHMAAVLPDLQGRGIGQQLKQAQREWALERGYRDMAWTFDPLQSGNANFNFNRLGITAWRYEVNHYGAMRDGINAGLASDRLEAHWQLAAPRRNSPIPDELTMLLSCDTSRNWRCDIPAAPDAPGYGIEIPLDIGALKQVDAKQAQQWQLAVRSGMLALLAAGYVVSGFKRGDGRAWYVLTRA
ncbi:MAG: GNAT family N-acetyltransferase [Chloroflexi bacterium]|nr:GNAT family N-acetyltransferase [Chloroflexota bacterium]MCY4246485.1 GNAT family N-acetyltransferase [Chloroflexota bacterium]